MTDITNPKLLWTKGVLFLGLALGAAALLVIEAPSLKVAALLAVSVWASCRAYYFVFGVMVRVPICRSMIKPCKSPAASS